MSDIDASTPRFLRGRYAIVGVGETTYRRGSSETTRNLATWAIGNALADAGLEPAEIGHINAHGTSTDLNDAAEAEAVVKVFGENTLPVTSAKGVIGHLIAAAGAVEAVASMLAMRDGLVPPTANHQRAEPELGIDVVAGEPRPVPAAPVVSNSFGFGGHNASLVLTPAS